MRIISLLTTIFCLSFSAYAQDIILSGLVLEKGTKTPLQDVTVSVQDDASLTSLTDKLGHFSLALPKSGSYILQATSEENETAYLAIHFAEDAPPLRSVVNNGYERVHAASLFS